jgi:outer membrane receptor for ferrienterochelin and colicins
MREPLKRNIGMSLKKIFLGVMFVAVAAWQPTAGMAAEPPSSQADTEVADMSLEDLLDVSVTGASRFEQPISEAPASVTVVTADEIKKYGYRTLADILQGLPGFYVTNDRSYSYLGVRGFGRSEGFNNRILILLDGHRLNENIYGAAFIGNESVIDADLIEQVEFIRGAGSSLYGDNAFFGVINIITRKGGDVGAPELSASVGSHDTYTGRVSYGKRFGNGNEMLLSGSIYDSNGQTSLYFPEFSSINNGMAKNSDYERNRQFFGNFTLGDFTFTGAYSERRKGVPTATFGAVFSDPRFYNNDQRGFADLKYAKRVTSDCEISGRLFYDYYRYYGEAPYAYDPDIPQNVTINSEEAINHWWGAEFQVAKTFSGKHQVIAGAEFQNNLTQRNENHDLDPYYQYLNLNRKTTKTSLYLQDEYSLLSNLLINAGVRFDYFTSFGVNFSPRLAIVYSPFSATTLKAIYSESFRSPNNYESYYWNSASIATANTDLKPEKIRSYSLVWEQRLHERLRMSITGFYNQVLHPISLLEETGSDGNAYFIYRNRGEINALGAEVEFVSKFENGLQGRVTYTYTDAWDTATKARLENSPEHMVKVNVIVPLLKNRLFAGTEVQYMSPRRSIAGVHVGDRFIANLTLFSQHLLPGLEVSASIYNLFDKKFSDPARTDQLMGTIEQDGRLFRVKMTYSF